MLSSTKRRSPEHFRRVIRKYDDKLARAANPSQRAYAVQQKRRAEDGLRESLNGRLDVDERSSGIVDLRTDEYTTTTA